MYGAGSAEEIVGTAIAGRRVTAAELTRIDNAFPRGRRPRALPTL